MNELLTQVTELYRSGGFVAPPLLICSLALWYALGYRLLMLRRGTRASIASVVAGKASAGGVLGEALDRLRSEGRDADRIDAVVRAEQDELTAMAGTVAAVVAVAPLLGLLGTVNGMIETFDSLASMELFTRGGGIAAGVSEALFSTQMGLVVAIPGAVVGRLLARKQERLMDELAELGRRMKEGLA
jgi:biopolymer transport protein ExbB